MGNASAGGLAFVPATAGSGGPSIVIGGNTAGTTASVSSGTLNLAGSNGITLSQNGQSITILGGGSQTVQTQAAGNIAGVGTTTSGNISMTLNSAGLSLNAANLAGTGTAITGNASITLNSTGLSFNGSGLAGTATATTGNVAITLNSAGLSLNAGSLAGTGYTSGTTTGSLAGTNNSAGFSQVVPYMTRYIWPPPNFHQVISAPVIASASFQYVPIYMPVTGTRMDCLAVMSCATTASAVTIAMVWSIYGAIYTVSSNSISAITSGSTAATTTFASNTAGYSQISQTAIRPFSIPLNFNLPPGEYIVGFNLITNSSFSTGAATQALSITLSMMGMSISMQTVRNYAEWGTGTLSQKNFMSGMGVLNSASTGLSNVYGLSDIVQTGSSISQANIAIVFRNA